MSYVVREHGLIVVPIDIDIDTLSPNLTSLSTILHRYPTQCVCFIAAHIYGRRFDMQPCIDIVRQHNTYIDIVEDLAEAYSGGDYTGHSGINNTNTYVLYNLFVLCYPIFSHYYRFIYGALSSVHLYPVMYIQRTCVI